MHARAGAGEPNCILSWFCLAYATNSFERVRRNILARDQDARRVRELDHVREVGDRIVQRLLAVDRRHRRHRRLPAEQERVAVGRSLRDPIGAGHAARAADVLDDDLLAECFAQARAMMRPTVSTGPPAAYGTIMVTGRVGQSCARAAPEKARTPASAATDRRTHRVSQYLITTSRSVPDSAPHASPDRPSIWRTAAPRLFDGKLSNFSVAGSKRRIALAMKSVTQTLSFSST